MLGHVGPMACSEKEASEGWLPSGPLLRGLLSGLMPRGSWVLPSKLQDYRHYWSLSPGGAAEHGAKEKEDFAPLSQPGLAVALFGVGCWGGEGVTGCLCGC